MHKTYILHMLIHKFLEIFGSNFFSLYFLSSGYPGVPIEPMYFNVILLLLKNGNLEAQIEISIFL